MTSATTFCLPSLPVALILTFTTPTSGTREEILRKSKSCNIHMTTFEFRSRSRRRKIRKYRENWTITNGLKI